MFVLFSSHFIKAVKQIDSVNFVEIPLFSFSLLAKNIKYRKGLFGISRPLSSDLITY